MADLPKVIKVVNGSLEVFQVLAYYPTPAWTLLVQHTGNEANKCSVLLEPFLESGEHIGMLDPIVS